MALMEMHHHKKPAPPLTSDQLAAIEDSRAQSNQRKSGATSITTGADPFAICQPEESSPFPGL